MLDPTIIKLGSVPTSGVLGLRTGQTQPQMAWLCAYPRHVGYGVG